MVREFIVKAAVAPCRLVAAVSGGADSTALLLALADLRTDGFGVTGAHVNHHLRGEESDADEQFVRDLCARLRVPLRVADGTVDAERVRARGLEAAAREVRYAALATIREEEGARFVATAHQKNDQAETVLMRLVTGSGIGGLRGIHPVRDDGFIRPLLDVTRDEIEAFLRERGVIPREDRSNADPRFLRNRIRALLQELGGVDHLAAIAEQARLQWPILQRAIDEAERGSVEANEQQTRFVAWPADPWLRQALLHRHIRRLDPGARDVSARDLARLATELDTIQRVTVTRNLELVRDRASLILRRPLTPTADFELELTPGSPVYIPELQTTIGIARAASPPELTRRRDRQVIELPAGADPRFTVRNRRDGDRFTPLGLAGSKKLKDFLIDRKIAAEVRDRLPLLLWNDQIVWVAGIEVSDRFKVTGSPSGVLYEAWMEGAGGADDRDQSRFHG